MFTSGERTFNIFDIFFIIIFLLSIAQIIISSILRQQMNSKLKNYSIIKVEEIPILALESINFTQDKIKPKYYPNIPNLGLTGELILDCYSGLCAEEKWRTKTKEICEEDDEGDTYCYDKDFLEKYYEDRIDYNCSFECFELKGNTCNNCTNSSFIYNDTKGKCSRNTNDIYSYGKYCLSDNIIYFCKGGKYENKSIKIDNGYLNNVILKNEECPDNTKNCGILDDNENKLCISDDLNCPINTISEEKLNNSYSSFKIGNKTFYYGYDENAKNKKIISGLYVDTDIYLNKEEENYTLLDTYTISGLLEENKILYKGVNLGFDPYLEKDIDKKGKSYLKIKYNKNVDLINMREKFNNYLKKKSFQNRLISSVTHKFNIFNTLGIIGYSIFIFIIIILMLIAFCIKPFFDESISDIQRNFLYCFIPTFIFFITFTLIPTIKSCTIIGKLNEINKEINISSLKKINIIFIILSFLLYVIILLFILIICLYRKIKDLLKSEKKNEKKNANETTINNFTIGSEIKNNITTNSEKKN